MRPLGRGARVVGFGLVSGLPAGGFGFASVSVFVCVPCPRCLPCCVAACAALLCVCALRVRVCVSCCLPAVCSLLPCVLLLCAAPPPLACVCARPLARALWRRAVLLLRVCAPCPACCLPLSLSLCVRCRAAVAAASPAGCVPGFVVFGFGGCTFTGYGHCTFMSA